MNREIKALGDIRAGWRVRDWSGSPECGCLTAAFVLAADGRKPGKQLAGVGSCMRTITESPTPGLKNDAGRSGMEGARPRKNDHSGGNSETIVINSVMLTGNRLISLLTYFAR